MTVFTTSRMGRMARRACTSDLRSANVCRCNSLAMRGLSSKSSSSTISISSSSDSTASKYPSTITSSSPWISARGPYLIRSPLSSQRRTTTSSMSKVGSSRTVTKPRGRLKADTRPIVNSVLARLCFTAYAVMKRCVAYRVALGRSCSATASSIACRSSPSSSPSCMRSCSSGPQMSAQTRQSGSSR